MSTKQPCTFSSWCGIGTLYPNRSKIDDRKPFMPILALISCHFVGKVYKLAGNKSQYRSIVCLSVCLSVCCSYNHVRTKLLLTHIFSTLLHLDTVSSSMVKVIGQSSRIYIFIHQTGSKTNKTSRLQ